MHGHLLPVRFDGSHAGHKTTYALFGGHAGHLMQHLADIARIAAFIGQAFPVIGVAGRMHTRPAVQGVYHKAGIVSHTHKARGPGHGACLDQGVFLKGGPVFLNIPYLREGVQAQHLHTICCQRAGQLPHLARIACGQHNAACIFFVHISTP